MRQFTDKDHDALDKLWEAHKEKAEMENNETYIPFDDMTLRHAGLEFDNAKSAGNFTVWPEHDTNSRYFLSGFGQNRYRLFKRR